MNIFVLKDPRILGDEDPKYGFTVWSETDGDFPVMFNSKQGNILPGTRVMADESTQRTSKYGKQYLRLKGAKLEDNPVPKEDSKPFEGKPEPTFEKATAEQNSKDQQITKNMVWKNLLQFYDVTSMSPDTPQWDEFWASVELHTEMLSVGNISRLKPATIKDKLEKGWTKEEPDADS